MQLPENGFFFHFSVVIWDHLTYVSGMDDDLTYAVSRDNEHVSQVKGLRKNLLRFVCSFSVGGTKYFPTQYHRVIELVYHSRGKGVTTLGNGKKIEFDRYGTVVYPALLKHDQRMYTMGTDICIQISQSASSAENGVLFPEALYVPPVGRKKMQADPFVHSEFVQLAQLRPNPSRGVELDLRVTALVVRLLQLNHSVAQHTPKSSMELYISQARQFIHENYAKIKSMEEVSKHVGMSEDYLRHLFAEQGGISLNRLLNQTKIERVKELLIHSRLPLKEIASLSGFATERYLSTRFKQLVGVSPGTFRRESQKGWKLEEII